MAAFDIPAAPKKQSMVIEAFRGVDLNNSPSNVHKSRSPEAPNMIRDQVGKVRKRTGYTTMVTAPGGGRINGVHRSLSAVSWYTVASLVPRKLSVHFFPRRFSPW